MTHKHYESTWENTLQWLTNTIFNTKLHCLFTFFPPAVISIPSASFIHLAGECVFRFQMFRTWDRKYLNSQVCQEAFSLLSWLCGIGLHSGAPQQFHSLSLRQAECEKVGILPLADNMPSWDFVCSCTWNWKCRKTPVYSRFESVSFSRL